MDTLPTSPCLCATLRKANRVVTNRYNDILKPSGLKITQFSMLVNISRNEGITISELAKIMIMDQTTVTRNLKLLEKNKDILFKDKGEDLRAKHIYVSDGGTQKLQQAMPLWQKAQKEIEDNLGKLGFGVFLQSLTSVIE